MLDTYNSQYEECLHNLQLLAKYYLAHHGTRNEATTRLHLIDTLLFDCLGWEKQDVITEEHQRKERNEFTDYTFYAPRRIMILEAKREGDHFEIPASKVALTYTLKSLCKGNLSLRAAVQQAANYCQSRGVPLATVCNGHQLVAFVATRSDGIAPMDGKALVFPSLEIMEQHFFDLWNAVSKTGIEDKTLQSRLLGTHQSELPPTLAASISGYPGTKGRNGFQTELKNISELVIEDIPQSEQVENDFLKECYCHSGAISQYSLVSKNILKTRYEALFDETSSIPLTVAPATDKLGISKELYAMSMSRRPILLLGNVGVGKSTFIRYFITIAASDLLENAICLRIDLGTQATLTPELNDYVVDEIINQLRVNYKISIGDGDFVLEVYKSDLELFEKSVYSKLLPSGDPYLLQKKVQFFDARLNDSGEHCRRSLEYICRRHRKQIVIFIDNADQRGEATQDAAFLIAQEIAAQWPALVYIPLRPETFYRSVREGALSGYHLKAFTIAPPRIDLVLEKRLVYALKVADGLSSVVGLSPEQLHIRSLKVIIRSFLKSLRVNQELIECLENIAGDNVRRALDLVKGFFGSGHVDTEEIVAKSSPDRLYEVSLHQFLRATIFGDCVHYDPSRSPLANIFDLSANDPKEHFLLPIVLSTIRQRGHGNKGFLETDVVYESLQSLGFTPDQIDFAIVRAYRKRMLETPASQSPEIEARYPRMIRATPIGLYHIDRLACRFAYVDAMVVATPILDRGIREKISDVEVVQARVERATLFRAYLDKVWSDANFPALAYSWPAMSDALGNDMLRVAKGSRGSGR